MELSRSVATSRNQSKTYCFLFPCRVFSSGKARQSPDELDHLLKLGSAELGRDFVDSALMEQQDSRDNGFGHALGGSPAQIIWMKNDSKRFVMRRNIFR